MAEHPNQKDNNGLIEQPQAHQHWMQRAIQLAQKGLYTTAPNPQVGAVIVHQGQVIGEGFHRAKGEPHAEINAIQDALDKGVSKEKFKSSTIYVTLEPCSHFGATPPCCQAISGYGFPQVVIALKDPNPLVSGRGIDWLKQHKIDVVIGVEAQAAFQLNKAYFYSMRLQKPFTTVKVAASIDGKTALANGQSQWITGEAARQDVHEARSLHHCILTGFGTFEADNPGLNVRNLPEDHSFWQTKALGVKQLQPRRFLIDAMGESISNPKFQQHQLLHTQGDQQPTGVFVAEQLLETLKENQKHLNIELIGIETMSHQHKMRLNLQHISQHLHQMGLQSLYIEAGSNLAGAFVQAQLVDELQIYYAPKILGSNGRGLLQIQDLETLADSNPWTLHTHQLFGEDIKISLRKNVDDEFIQEHDRPITTRTSNTNRFSS